MSSDEFKSCPVAVLGAASGIGRATALAFARRGAKVAALDVNAGPLETFADDLRAAGAADALTGTVDVRDGASVDAGVQQAVTALGGLTIWFSPRASCAWARCWRCRRQTSTTSSR